MACWKILICGYGISSAEELNALGTGRPLDDQLCLQPQTVFRRDFEHTLNHNNILNAILRDAVYRRRQGVLYFQNIDPFGTDVNVI